jgi:death on curing protein
VPADRPDQITWVPVEVVIDLHAELLEEHGGAAGLRDRGALESALARPRQLHAYDPEADLHALAAAVAGGIIRNHPFVDGNKRAAFVALGVFLALNGRYLDATEQTAERVIAGLAEGRLGEAELTAWLREHCVPADE